METLLPDQMRDNGAYVSSRGAEDEDNETVSAFSRPLKCTGSPQDESHIQNPFTPVHDTSH